MKKVGDRRGARPQKGSSSGDSLLLQFNRLLLRQRFQDAKKAHDILLHYLRKEDNPAPQWELCPVARDYFLQRYP